MGMCGAAELGYLTDRLLSPDEIKRRLDAARTLRGLKQTELAELVQADGLGKHDVGRLERGAIPLTRALRDALCRHLRVPAGWFTDEDIDFGAVTRDEMDLDERVARMEDRLSALIDAQNGLLGRQSDILEQIREEQSAIRELVGSELNAVRALETAAASLRAVAAPTREPQESRPESPRTAP